MRPSRAERARSLRAERARAARRGLLLLFGGVLVGGLALAFVWQPRSPGRRADGMPPFCVNQYAAARTMADTQRVDRLRPPAPRRSFIDPWPRRCGDARLQRGRRA